VSNIESTADRFWAADEGVLVSSVDGLRWTSVDLDADGLSVYQLAATRSGDLAVTLVDDSQLPFRSEKHVLASHDNGATWTQPIRLGGAEQGLALDSVGPAGVSLSLDVSEGTTSRYEGVFIGTGSASSPYIETRMRTDSRTAARLTVGNTGFVRVIGDDVMNIGELTLEVYGADGELIGTAQP